MVASQFQLEMKNVLGYGCSWRSRQAIKEHHFGEEKKKRLIFTHQKARQGGGGVHSVTLKESAGNSQNTPKLQIHEIFWLHVIIGEG